MLDWRADTTKTIWTPRRHGSICQHRSKGAARCINLLNIPQPILNCSAVTTEVSLAPRHHRSICQDRGKSIIRRRNLLNISQAILNCSAVTAFILAPCHHGSICQDRSKSTTGSRNLLNVSQSILNCSAVTPAFSVAPCHHGSICQDCSKSTRCATNLLNISEPILDCSAVTAVVWLAPGHYGSICQERSKSPIISKNLLNVPDLIFDCNAVTTVCNFTPCDNPIKAKANIVPAIFGCWAKAVMLFPSWRPENWRDSVGSKRRPSGATSLRNLCPKDRCAAIFKSATLPDCRTEMVSDLPLGKDTWSSRAFRIPAVSWPQRRCFRGKSSSSLLRSLGFIPQPDLKALRKVPCFGHHNSVLMGSHDLCEWLWGWATPETATVRSIDKLGPPSITLFYTINSSYSIRKQCNVVGANMILQTWNNAFLFYARYTKYYLAVRQNLVCTWLRWFNLWFIDPDVFHLACIHLWLCHP